MLPNFRSAQAFSFNENLDHTRETLSLREKRKIELYFRSSLQPAECKGFVTVAKTSKAVKYRKIVEIEYVCESYNLLELLSSDWRSARSVY